ncbi:MAG: hypothetical protein M1819_003527 [Sarea resinae]|nr:MAG: hypothetical protein M1819_003527 [Sarea resinae]
MAATADQKQPPYGQRLLPQVVDQTARDHPERPWVSIPRTSNLADGYVDITYKQFANAVNRMARWLEDRLGRSSTFETLAYMGPTDPRYPILALAAVKAGYQMLFVSLRNSDSAQYAVMKASHCGKFLCSSSLEQRVAKLMEHYDYENAERRAIVVPDLKDFIDDTPVPHYPYEKTFAEARREPLLRLHTSGTTGAPKPIQLRHGYGSQQDLLRFFPLVEGRGIVTFHAGGIQLGLIKSIFIGETNVYPPSDKPLSADLVNDIFIHAKCDGCLLPPSLIEDLVEVPEFRETLSKLKYIAFGSGPLAKASGDILHKLNKNCYHWMGQTESELLPAIRLEDPENDWQYWHFHPWAGVEMRPFGGDKELHALYIKRIDDMGYPAFIPVFENFPHLEEYDFKDLFSQHPTKPYLWRHRGRSDDVLVLSNGEKLNPVTAEGIIGRGDLVNSALIVGKGKFQPGLLVELKGALPENEHEKMKIIDELWPVVEQANLDLPAYGQLTKSLVTFASPEKSFLRTPKGTVIRPFTVDLFAKEIEDMYTAAAQAGPLEDGDALGIVDPQSPESVRDFVREAITRVRKSPPPDDDVDFFSAGMDSLQVVNLVRLMESALESHLSIPKSARISTRIVYRNPDVASLATALTSLLTIAQTAPDGEIELMSARPEDRTQKLEETLAKWSVGLPTKSTAPHTDGADRSSDAVNASRKWSVILTGSTGSLGSYLLDALLAQPHVTKVICVNRAADAVEKQKKVNESRGLTADFTERVDFYQTDNLNKPFFGFKPEEYENLRKTVTQVIHNAWPVNFNLALESFDSHIGGVRRLIEFSAASAKHAQIFFVSSISSIAAYNPSKPENDGGDNHHSLDMAPEEIIEDFSSPEPMGYGESKCVSERLLQAASVASLGAVPSTVLRVGQIAGPIGAAGKGIWNEREWFPSMIKSSQTLGTLPDSLGSMNTVDWIPVDVLSKVVVELMQAAEAASLGSGISSVYHLVNPTALSWPDLLPAIRARLGGEGVKVISLREWIETVRAGPSADAAPTTPNPSVKILDFFEGIARSAPAGVRFRTERASAASEALRTLGPVRPEWVRAWMDQWGYPRTG